MQTGFQVEKGAAGGSEVIMLSPQSMTSCGEGRITIMHIYILYYIAVDTDNFLSFKRFGRRL